MEFNLTLKVLDKNLEKYFLDFKDKISALINVSKINFLKEDTLDASFIPLAFDGGICYVEKPSELDIEDVKAKLTSKIEKLNKQKLGLEAKLGNESFVKNAPEELVASEQKNLAELKESVEKLEAIIKVL